MHTRETLEKLLLELGDRVFYNGAWTPICTLNTGQILEAVETVLCQLNVPIIAHEAITGQYWAGPTWLLIGEWGSTISLTIEDGRLSIDSTVDSNTIVARLLSSDFDEEDLLWVYRYIKTTNVSPVQVGKLLWQAGIHKAEDWIERMQRRTNTLMTGLTVHEQPSIFEGNIPTPTWLELKHTLLAFIYSAFN